MEKKRVLKSAKQKPERRSSIIAITAHAYESDKTEFLNAGMNQVITKPFDELQLMNMLLKFIKR